MLSINDLVSPVNAWVVALLRSPLHPLASKGLMVVSWSGRRTGKGFAIPVGYQVDGDGVVVMLSKREEKSWWKNFRTAWPAELHVRGVRREATGVVVPAVAGAHPHVFIDARSEIVFDTEGRMNAVRNIWQFDEAFTAYAIQGLDTDEDGQLTDAELAPLARVNVESLQEFDFFTFLTVDSESHDFAPPDEYWLEFYGGKLTLFFTLPLEAPVAVGTGTTLEVFDPEYFVAFSFTEDVPISLVDAPATCEGIFTPPGELDAQTATILGSLPASQRDLPPDLQAAAAVLSNRITVSC